MRALLVAALAALVPLWTPTAHGQTPVNGFSAMQPSVGRFTVHEMGFYRQFDGDSSTQDRDLRQGLIASQIAFGLLSNLAVVLDVPVLFNHFESSALAPSDEAIGVGDMLLYGKYRFWQHDSGPTDTERLAFIGGLQIPGGTDSYADSTEGEWNPIMGLIYSIVRGRHGGNASVLYELDTGGHSRPDGLRYDLSYIYRLSPASFDAQSSHGAWYVMAELNGLYETNGNHQLFLAPGVMYEATWWTVDATVGIPLFQDLKDRPDMEIVVGVGLRVNF